MEIEIYTVHISSRLMPDINDDASCVFIRTINVVLSRSRTFGRTVSNYVSMTKIDRYIIKRKREKLSWWEEAALYHRHYGNEMGVDGSIFVLEAPSSWLKDEIYERMLELCSSYQFTRRSDSYKYSDVICFLKGSLLSSIRMTI